MPQPWHVAAIVNEPLPVILRFVSWYLAEGATSLTLYFDDPADPAISQLQDHPQITCIRCTPAFWQTLGLTPDTRFPKRQNAAMTQAYHSVGQGWFVNVDADELLLIQGRSIADVLAEQSVETQAVRILTAEAIRVAAPSGPSHFRLPMERAARRRVYRDKGYLFGPRRFGFVGHSQGKSMTRLGLDAVRVRQHWVTVGGVGPVHERVLDRSDGAYLLHFSEEGFASWRSKVEWRSRSAGFTKSLTAHIQSCLDAPDPETALRETYDNLYEMDAAQLARLRDEGALLTVDLGLRDRIARFFPGHAGA